MVKLTKASFAAAKRRLGIGKVTKKNIGRIAKEARKGGKSKSKTKKSKTTSSKTTSKGGNKRMGSRRQSIFQTVKKISLVGAIAAPGLGVALRKDIGWPEKIGAISEKYFAYNTHRGTFEPGRLIEGYGPYITTKLVHKGIAALNKLIQGI